MAAIVHVGYRPGCIHRILELHEDYYRREAGFGQPFELKIAKDLSEFMARFNEESDLLLLGLVDGTLEGSLVIDGAKAEQHGAHLRWFIVSDAVRGKGLGKMLMDRAMAFIKMRGYTSTYLWTFDELAAARHLYTRYGFRLARQTRPTLHFLQSVLSGLLPGIARLQSRLADVFEMVRKFLGHIRFDLCPAPAARQPVKHQLIPIRHGPLLLNVESRGRIPSIRGASVRALCIRRR